MLMIMGKDNAIKLPKALKKLNLAPTSFKVWEKVRLEFLPVPSTGVLPSRGDHGIRKGFFAVYVGKEAKRYVIPLSYLKHPVFLQLLKKAEEEFGFGGGGLQIPCDTEVFDRVLLFVGREHDPSHDGKMEELLKLFMQPRRAC